MVMATCLAATAVGGPCQMTWYTPGTGAGIGAGVGEGGGVEAAVVGVGEGCREVGTWVAEAARRGFVPQPARTAATPSPRRPRRARRSTPWQCGQVMMRLPRLDTTVSGKLAYGCAPRPA